MIERLLIVVAIAGAILLIWGGIRLWQARRLQSLPAAPLLAGIVPLGKPAVVGFAMPGCRECRSRQAPALAQLASLLGDQITVETVLALEYPQLVDRLGILTVPATVVLDAHGIVYQVNQGFTDAATLMRQVQLILQHRSFSNADLSQP
ncbi:MAG: thioredoxin [Chloroflexus sp.]